MFRQVPCETESSCRSAHETTVNQNFYSHVVKKKRLVIKKNKIFSNNNRDYYFFVYRYYF